MAAFLSSVMGRLVETGRARATADGLFRRYARHRVGILDRCPAHVAQRNTLLRLVRRGKKTRFGRDHEFGRIRSVRDYQDRVPLRDYEAFWKEYWQPAFPDLRHVSWPGEISYLALSSGTTTGSTKFIPVSREMLASNRRAALATLSLFQVAHPAIRLFSGRLFFLGGSTDLSPLTPAQSEQERGRHKWHARYSRTVLAGDLSGIAAREVPALFRPFTFPPLDLALFTDWDLKIRLLAERSAGLPITLVGGVPAWLLVLFERLREVTGREHLVDIWPRLQLVVHGGTCFEPYRSLFRSIVGTDRVRFLETYPASEGFVATEDPRYGLLRLIPDHGVFFEFVPVGELGANRPTRHTVREVVPSVQYAVVLTTCAGLWSYVLGDTIAFERRDPPLLRFTGRTRYSLSAFGEHLIAEEVERAIAAAADRTGAAVVDFHVGPVFSDAGGAPGRHRYLVEFARDPAELAVFGRELDTALCQLNDDYRAHRTGDLTIGAPEVRAVERGGFADWMRSRGQYGGQHKLPRMDNSGRLTAELTRWLEGHSPRRLATTAAERIVLMTPKCHVEHLS